LKEAGQAITFTSVILITGFGSIETAVESMKMGAYDYITKPINDHEIKIVIAKIVERKRVMEENLIRV